MESLPVIVAVVFVVVIEERPLVDLHGLVRAGITWLPVRPVERKGGGPVGRADR